MKHYIIGEILEDGTVERGQTAQGFIYKNSKAFYDKTEEVCYIPEIRDEEYTYADFMDIAKENFDIAKYLFNTVDWQSPETLLSDEISNDEIHLCEECDKYFMSYEVDNCPYCNYPKEDI